MNATKSEKSIIDTLGGRKFLVYASCFAAFWGGKIDSEQFWIIAAAYFGGNALAKLTGGKAKSETA